MKIRMIWEYIIDNGDGIKWYGTCPKWAKDSEWRGVYATRHRVQWVGPLPSCPACVGGHH